MSKHNPNLPRLLWKESELSQLAHIRFNDDEFNEFLHPLSAPDSDQSFDCNLMWICPCLPLEADLDIGGIGNFSPSPSIHSLTLWKVVTAFIGTCGIAILISITALTVLPEEPRARLWENTGTPLDDILPQFLPFIGANNGPKLLSGSRPWDQEYVHIPGRNNGQWSEKSLRGLEF
jgi:hypothetical protein